MSMENFKLNTWVLAVPAVLVWAALIAFALGWLQGCAGTLPHRESWEVNHGQGRNPPTDCPGQYKQWSNQGNDGFVIGCWGHNE